MNGARLAAIHPRRHGTRAHRQAAGCRVVRAVQRVPRPLDLPAADLDHIDNWFPAAHPDEAVAAARRRFPTADAWEYLGERRDLTAAEIEALRRSNAAK